MQRHAFRSVCNRTRPELEQASDALRNYARQFSTSQIQAADGPSTPRPAARPAQTGGPKVIDIKSLPLRGRGGLRGRGSFRGRGGFGGRGGSSTQDRSSSPVRTGQPMTRGRGRGGFSARGRGGRGGRGRGGRGGNRGDRRKDDDDKDRNRDRNEFNNLDPDEQSFEDSIRFGMRSEYTPSLTLESINQFAPAAPSTASGKSATVMQNLSVLGTADHVGAPEAFQAKYYASEIEASGIRFFADTEAKKAAEQYLQGRAKAEGKEITGPIIAETEEAIRQVITQRAIQGQHETPKFASDPVGVSRSWHLRSETYTTHDVNSFQTKLTSLLDKKGAGGKGGKANA